MNAKEILYQLRIADVKINNKIKELENFKIMMDSLGGGAGERVQSSRRSHDKFADRVATVVDLEREINKDVDNYVDLKARITKMIDKVQNSEHLDVLYKRYVNNKSWLTISSEMKYSESYLYKLHGRALKEFKEVNKLDSKG